MMMKRIIPFSLGIFLLITTGTSGCKPDSASQSAENKQRQDDAIQDLDKAFEQLKAGNNEVVDFRVLKDALPEKLLGMERVDHSGQKSGVAGLQISFAEASYKDDGRKISIQITDTGGLGAALAGMAAWSQIEIDNENEEGYERTTMIDNKKAFERYNRVSQEGEISMITADRFIISINGNGISESDMRKAISSIRISK